MNHYLVTAVLLSLAGLLPAQRQRADITAVQVGTNERVIGTLAEDLNGDGLVDLVLVTHRRGEGVSQGRYLQVHLQRRGSPAFVNRPERPPWNLPANVVGFAVAEVHTNPGVELVLFSPTLAVALFWTGDADPEVVSLVATSLLWQPARERRIVNWQAGVRDLDGDGLVDLVLPEPRGYRIAFQRRRGEAVDFESVAFLGLPPGPMVEDRRQQGMELRLSFGVGDAGNPWLLRVNDSVPAPQLADWDGDGDLDLIILRQGMVLVWTLEDRAFRGPQRHDLQVQTRATFDPAYLARAVDVNGDGRADVVMGSSRTSDSEVTSTVAVWIQDGEPLDAPGDRLRFRGFAGMMDLVDVDGDGMPELVVGSIRTDLINALTAGEQRLDAQLNVLRNGYRNGEGFVRPVALVHTMAVRALLDTDRITATFFGDCDGNGLKDLVVRDGRRRIQVVLVTENGSELRLSEPVWEMQIAPGSRVESLAGTARPSLLIVEDTQVVFVRMR